MLNVTLQDEPCIDVTGIFHLVFVITSGTYPTGYSPVIEK